MDQPGSVATNFGGSQLGVQEGGGNLTLTLALALGYGWLNAGQGRRTKGGRLGSLTKYWEGQHQLQRWGFEIRGCTLSSHTGERGIATKMGIRDRRRHTQLACWEGRCQLQKWGFEIGGCTLSSHAGERGIATKMGIRNRRLHIQLAGWEGRHQPTEMAWGFEINGCRLISNAGESGIGHQDGDLRWEAAHSHAVLEVRH